MVNIAKAELLDVIIHLIVAAQQEVFLRYFSVYGCDSYIFVEHFL